MNLSEILPLILAGLILASCATEYIQPTYYAYRETSVSVEEAYDICKMEADMRLHDTGWFLAAKYQSESYMHSCMAGHGYKQ